MQEDFHYYATYCAAYLAGYSHAASLDICYSAQLVDLCSVTWLAKLGGPKAAATTQLQLELMQARTDKVGLQDITRIWSSFHFLPYDLKAEFPGKRAGRAYRNKYRLVCRPNGALVRDTVEQAAKAGSLQAIGIAMHVLADTWAHSYFAGTPSLVINNTTKEFYEIVPGPDGETRRPVKFGHNPGGTDDIENGVYTNSIYQAQEDTIMNLGHGRAGHLPDYSFARYEYLPAWAGYRMVRKDNPEEYYQAFCQMVYAMKWIREKQQGANDEFALNTYATDIVAPWEEEIRGILTKRQLNASGDWWELGERMSGQEIPEFDLERYEADYQEVPEHARDNTFLGRFFVAALGQKSMVTSKIFTSGSLLAGFSVDFSKKGFRGMRDYRRLLKESQKALETAMAEETDAIIGLEPAGTVAREQIGGEEAEK